jgi:hypothetical protein
MLNLRGRITRLERKARIRRRWIAVYAEIARRQKESEERVANWRRGQIGEPVA